MAAETNTILTTDLSDAQVREIEFVELFEENISKLIEALGITRKIPKQAGTILKTYKATGTLESGKVAEGETIPLSKYTIKPITYKELTPDKWRKATTAEAIIEYGFNQAVTMTTDRMLKDVQKTIRTKFFDFLATGTGKASGTDLQAALAQSWAQLQVLFEDNAIESVHFINPLDIANYLATAQVTTQTAFGMTYLEDFLGMGTVFLNASVPQGKIYSTAKDNVVLYYIPINGADLGNVFDFTTDATGYVGIHEVPKYENLTAEDVIMSGIEIFAEKLDGVVVGTINQTILE